MTSAYVSSYSFDAMTRYGNDDTYQDQKTLQSAKYGNYMLSNFFASDCMMESPIKFATSQPNINFAGPHLAAQGCNIDDSSTLSIGSLSTTSPSRISLHPRSHLSVPYMSRGLGDPILEAKLQQGEQVMNRKSVTTITEQSFQNHHFYPLIGSLRDDVTNPHKLIEESASRGWVRGGIPSRELNRDSK